MSFFHSTHFLDHFGPGQVGGMGEWMGHNGPQTSSFPSWSLTCFEECRQVGWANTLHDTEGVVVLNNELIDLICK